MESIIVIEDNVKLFWNHNENIFVIGLKQKMNAFDMKKNINNIHKENIYILCLSVESTKCDWK